jgi:hypothetical protein
MDTGPLVEKHDRGSLIGLDLIVSDDADDELVPETMSQSREQRREGCVLVCAAVGRVPWRSTGDRSVGHWRPEVGAAEPSRHRRGPCPMEWSCQLNHGGGSVRRDRVPRGAAGGDESVRQGRTARRMGRAVARTLQTGPDLWQSAGVDVGCRTMNCTGKADVDSWRCGGGECVRIGLVRVCFAVKNHISNVLGDGFC